MHLIFLYLLTVLSTQQYFLAHDQINYQDKLNDIGNTTTPLNISQVVNHGSTIDYRNMFSKKKSTFEDKLQKRDALVAGILSSTGV